MTDVIYQLGPLRETMKHDTRRFYKASNLSTKNILTPGCEVSNGSPRCRIHDAKVRPEDLSSRPGIDTRAISLGIFRADSMMKNPGGHARYKLHSVKLDLTSRQFSTIPDSSWGTRVREGQCCLCSRVINWSRSIERSKQLIQIPYRNVILTMSRI